MDLRGGVVEEETDAERAATGAGEGGEQRLERMLAALQEVVYEAEILDDGSWRQLYQGPGLERLLGTPLPGGGVAPTAWAERVHPDDRRRYLAYVERLQAGHDAVVEYRVAGDDGRERVLRSRGHARHRPGGGVLVSGMLSDVSAAHEARTELAEARAALDRVVSGIDEVLYTLELEPGAEPRLTYLGPGWDRLVGRPITAEESARWLMPLVHPDDVPTVVAANARLARGEAVEMAYRLVADGRERHVIDRARPRPGTVRPVVADGIVIDVTERVRAESALRDSEARLRRVTREAPIVLLEVDADGIVRFADGRGLEALGLRPGESVGRSVFDLFGHGSDIGRAVLDTLADGVPVASTLTVGDVVYDARYEPQVDGAGAVTGLVAVALDVTARVQAERAVAELADEQAALLRVATAVANEFAPAEVFDLVAEETCRLLGADGAAVTRLAPGGDVVVVGSARATGEPSVPPGTVIRRVPGGLVDSVGSGTASVRRRTLGPEVGEMVPALGRYRSAVAASVTVGGDRWGLLVVGSTVEDRFPAAAERRLARFAALVGTAIANAEARDELAARASTDPLTGLLNHRGFHERLAQALQRTRRHGSELSLVLMDIDHFKAVNDAVGHQVGDRVLVTLAERLAAAHRAGEVLGRLGGDEFALLLPDVGPVEAFEAADRLRERIAAAPIEGHQVTVSVGVCDLARAGDDADVLFGLADRALFSAKGRGRNAALLYSSDVVPDVSAEEQARRLTRHRALAGVRALARAIDARDPSGAHHSERVAELAAALAGALGWPPAEVARLRDAARVHDVGKIGVPDSVLLKPGALTAVEVELMQRHAELGARIAHEVLDHDQVAWIRAHHERPDGRGYPRGLTGAAIPEGAAILAVADSWDVMTSDRPYRSGMGPDEAAAECRRCVGTQFRADIVDALLELQRARPAGP